MPGLASEGRARGEPRRYLVPVGELCETSGRRVQRQPDVAEERHIGGMLAAERLRAIGDMEDCDAFGHGLGVAIRVGDESASADQHDRLRRLEVGAHVGEIGFQYARPAWMG